MPTSWGFFGKFPPFMRLQVDRGLLEALASLWTGPLAFPLGTRGSCPYYGGLDRPFSETPVIPIRGPRSNRCLEKYLGLSFTSCGQEGIAGKRGGRNSESMPSRSLSQETGRGGSDVLHTAPSSSGSAVTCSHLRHSTASRLLITLRGIRVEALDSLCPLRWSASSWGVGLYGLYYPSLALRQFGGVQYPPRLGDLDAVTFDYIPSEDMWRLLSSRVEVIWEGRLSEVVLIEDGSPGDSSVLLTSDFVEWREKGGLPFSLSGLLYGTGTSHSFGVSSVSLRVSASTAEREASAARVESLRSTLHHNSVAVANLRRDLEAQRGNVSTLHFWDGLRNLAENLAETREQLETEQAERTRVQDELDSLELVHILRPSSIIYQALVDPATGPQDIVALRRALDASEEALTSALRTSMGAMRVQISVLQGPDSSSPDQSGDGILWVLELAPVWGAA
uniref:Uncharacterized protein n=1 Tax=Fagus sylvatica TaxID=28930 RepID=A0A2N9IA79_FAGSY